MPACPHRFPAAFLLPGLLGATCLTCAVCCDSRVETPATQASAAGVPAVLSAGGSSSDAPGPPRRPAAEMATACRQRAARVRAALACATDVTGAADVTIAPPWVIVSRLPADELAVVVDHVILPFCAAVQREYALPPPTRPVTICLAADAPQYDRWSRLLAGCAPPSPAGFFERDRRVIVVALANREAALRHELTHALLAESHPYLPLWLAEGLAALHEAGDLEEASGRFQPDARWRAAPLRAALQRGDLPPLGQLLDADYARREAALFYAHARFWCLYLHAEDSLAQTLQLAADGPAGLPPDAWQLHLLIGRRTLHEAQVEFRNWLAVALADGAEVAAH